MRVLAALVLLSALTIVICPMQGFAQAQSNSGARQQQAQSIAPPQTAPNYRSQGATPQFSLSARVNAPSDLSRSEVDPTAAGMNTGALSMPPAPTNTQPQGYAPQGYPMRGAQGYPAQGQPVYPYPQGRMQNADMIGQLAALAAQTRAAALQAQASQVQNDAPGAFMSEQVDWSRWVSLMADRWFYVLRNAESQLGVQFMTSRPALIQFTCYADGTIGNIVLRQSSGVPAYDRLQVASLLQAVPTPPFPAGTRRSSITLVQGWESHPKQPGESDFQPGTFGKNFPVENVRKWCAGL